MSCILLRGEVMADIKSPQDRSKNMSRIRSKDTKPEVYIRKMLYGRGYRYRKNVSSVPGHPDAWFPKYNVALFVHGCFWHRHPGCQYAYTPKSRIDFWELKFGKNVERDQKVREKLREQGIRSLVVWECTVNRMIKSEEYRKNIADQIVCFLSGKKSELEL